MAIEIVDFPIKNGGSFHSKLLVYQRVTSTNIHQLHPTTRKKTHDSPRLLGLPKSGWQVTSCRECWRRAQRMSFSKAARRSAARAPGLEVSWQARKTWAHLGPTFREEGKNILIYLVKLKSNALMGSVLIWFHCSSMLKLANWYMWRKTPRNCPLS